MKLAKASVSKNEALEFHSKEKKGKLSIVPNKALSTVKDLSLAYSPGVGYPCLEIQKEPKLAYEYTTKGNFVAVISNGTAVLGYGNIGALASKPVMEGKSVLLKRFGGVDSIDILVDTQDVSEMVNVVRCIGNTWGGINLEDIKAPDCFIVEAKLRKLLKVPVFHDDQHGTATIVLAGLINAANIANKNIKSLKVVINGAGAAGIASANLLTFFGIPKTNIILCDTAGVIFKGREERMNEWKESYATNNTNIKTLGEAVVGADVLVGLSAKGAVTPEMLLSMNKSPIVFALANPDPEITPELATKTCKDIIIATGRSDYPNQVNNVMCFPYLFRAALDTRVTEITKEMQVAAAVAIAKIATEPVHPNVQNMQPDYQFKFGSGYILPSPYDPRLFLNVSTAVGSIAIQNKSENCRFKSIEEYQDYLRNKFKDLGSNNAGL